VTITNYERLGKFDAKKFGGVVLDESSILKNYSGAVRRQLTEAFRETPFKLACTATPAPNDTLELGQHSDFLDVLTSHEMIARWFLPDTDAKAGTYRLKGHAVAPFWDWVTTWARCVSKPSDLGHSDEGYMLPPIERHEHVVNVDVVAGRDAKADKRGQMALYRAPALSSTAVHDEKRRTVAARAAKLAELVLSEPGESWIIWCDTDYEDEAIRAVLPSAVSVRGSDKPKEKIRKLMGFTDGSVRYLITKPKIGGMGMNWQHCARAVRIGPTFSFEAEYQEERRIWRFGQKRPVHTHMIMASTEVDIWNIAQEKAREHEAMGRQMFAAARRAQLNEQAHSVAYMAEHRGRFPAFIQEGIGQ